MQITLQCARPASPARDTHDTGVNRTENFSRTTKKVALDGVFFFAEGRSEGKNCLLWGDLSHILVFSLLIVLINFPATRFSVFKKRTKQQQNVDVQTVT